MSGRDSSGIRTITPISSEERAAADDHAAVPPADGGTGRRSRRRRRAVKSAAERVAHAPATWWSAAAWTLFIAATGGIFAARRPGSQAASTVTRTPTTSAATIVRRGDDQRSGRDRRAERSPSRSAARPPRPIPADRPATAAISADDERLDQHGAGDLAAGGADGAHQGQFLGALGDQHGEGVGDEEDADEERDAGEGQQPCFMPLMSGSIVLGLLVGELRAGLWPRTSFGEQRLDRASSSVASDGAGRGARRSISS